MADFNTVQDAPESRPSYGVFAFHRGRGRWWFRVFGWGIRYKDSRRHLPNFEERINEVRNLKIGPHWFRLLRP